MLKFITIVLNISQKTTSSEMVIEAINEIGKKNPGAIMISGFIPYRVVIETRSQNDFCNMLHAMFPKQINCWSEEMGNIDMDYLVGLSGLVKSDIHILADSEAILADMDKTFPEHKCFHHMLRPKSGIILATDIHS